MGGPAMIEGGGLGKFKPEEVGPIGVQTKNGVVDVRVRDEAEAVAVAKKYLAFFQGPTTEWTCADQTTLRTALPERRRRAYKIRPIIETLADAGSVLELRRDFGRSVVTALARIEGQPFGVLANDPFHLGGAIDADAADKAARFLQLCDALGLPIVSLCDTPGFMVGPQAETTALVRHVSRMFVAAASLTVPYFTVVLRKGYGLGAQAMSGGHFHAPLLHRLVAHRRVRRNEPRGRRTARDAQAARGHRGPGRPRADVPGHRRDGLRARQGHQHGIASRGRRRDRSRRDAGVDYARLPVDAKAGTSGDETFRRYVVR